MCLNFLSPNLKIRVYKGGKEGNYFKKELDNNKMELDIVQSKGTTDPLVLTTKNLLIINSERPVDKNY